MEEANNLDTVKLKSVISGIFAGGDKAVDNFDCSAYTEAELKYIVEEMNNQNMADVDNLLKLAEAEDIIKENKN